MKFKIVFWAAVVAVAAGCGGSANLPNMPSPTPDGTAELCRASSERKYLLDAAGGPTGMWAQLRTIMPPCGAKVVLSRDCNNLGNCFRAVVEEGFEDANPKEGRAFEVRLGGLSLGVTSVTAGISTVLDLGPRPLDRAYQTLSINGSRWGEDLGSVEIYLGYK